MILAALLVAAQAELPALPNAWARFERSGALTRMGETVEIASDGFDAGSKAIEYKLRLTRTVRGDTETFWANSRSCPAIRPLLIAMRDIEMPRPAPYGIKGEESELVLDGAKYLLHAPSNFSMGDLTITSNVLSPLSRWVDRALTALDRCWSKVELRFPPDR